MKQGLLHLSKWTMDFKTLSQRQTDSQVWIWLMELRKEYFHNRTLLEFSSAIGPPLNTDNPTKNSV